MTWCQSFPEGSGALHTLDGTSQKLPVSAYNKARLMSPRRPLKRNDPSPPERPVKVTPPAEVTSFNPPGYDIPVAPMNLQRSLLDGLDEAGTPGQVLTSRGDVLAPIWADGGGGGTGGPGVTNLTVTNRTDTNLTVDCDTGTDAVLPPATAALAGLMVATDKAKLDAIPANAVFAGTDLSYVPATRLLGSSTGADVTLPLATQTVPGLMSEIDKTKVDSIPPAGVPGPTDLAYDETTRLLESSTGADVTLPLADATTAGLMSPADKALLDSIPPDAVFEGTDLAYDETTRLLESSTGVDVTLPLATDTVDGLLSAEDKAKLELIPATGPEPTDLTYTATTRLLESSTGADVVLPLATATVPGLLSETDKAKLDLIPATGPEPTDLTYTAGTRLLESSTGADVTLPLATATVDGLMSAEDKAVLETIPPDFVFAQPDWDALPGGDGEILNKPDLGTAAFEDVGVAGGVPPLDANGKVPAAFLPSYVDDVLEVANLAALPNPGETGIIYVTTDNDKVYRWTGTGYVEISPSPGTTDDVPEGTTNLYYTDERVQDLIDASALSSTDELPEGTTNLYYTDERVQALIDASALDSTDDLPEGTTNLYFTDQRAQDLIDASIAVIPPTDLTYTAATRLLESSDGTDVTLPLATTTVDGLMAAADKAKVDTIPPTGPAPTDLTYVAATRLLESSTGADVILPLATATVDGLMAAADKAVIDAIPADVDYSTPDWNAAAGAPGEILNKPDLGTAAFEDVGVAGGVPPLDANGKVPAVYLPSYVDDVIEVANQAALPATGEAGIIYVTADSNKIYRWSGTGYVEIAPSPGTTDDVPEGTTNLYYTDERVQALIDASPTDLAYTAATRLLESSTGADVTLPLATTTVDGLMSAADKVKVDAIPAAYVLPIATDTVLGGVMAAPSLGISASATGALRIDIASLPLLP
jgi:hypothetical protein